MRDLIASLDARASIRKRNIGRNAWTRFVDQVVAAVRKYAPPFHWIFASATAVLLYIYIKFVSFTVRFVRTGELKWPDLPSSVVALWHRDAPSLLIGFAKRRPLRRCMMLVADDPRGDCLALLCRMLGFTVVRRGNHASAWAVLEDLMPEIERGSAVFITVDGGGPPRVAKSGALIFAAVASVPLIALRADCWPALEEVHKWDAARNPLPFSRIVVSLSTPRCFEPFTSHSSILGAREWLQGELDKSL
jgi:lysophospholipid acyltransferase (LPLAT)-like uncharacterized protein